MALSQKDLLRRIKQKVNIKIGVSSPVQGSSSHKEPESGLGITIREPTLKKRKLVSNSTREGLLHYLHQAEASSLFLVNHLEVELVKIRQVLKDKEIELGGKETELATLRVKVHELIPKMETYETQVQELAEKCKKLENEKEEMADQLCTTLNQGFQLALNQIKVLCPDVDISGADITKEVVDGQLVEITDD
ncbi:hypothetical protein DEO72_LG10g1336 [Vigna unguiculata]|uniref:Uncharacterized protein n=1 Tax=Vigna unguiculata TaxID=3917 RepID=A0A4D6N8F7_VIGUN|nr:hypothetical protein DEO72_LG10g1336 [Vigna unguiculata]